MTGAYFHIASIPYQPGQRFFAPLPEDIQPEVTERVEAGTQVVIYRLSKKWFCSPAHEVTRLSRCSFHLSINICPGLPTINSVWDLISQLGLGLPSPVSPLRNFTPLEIFYLCDKFCIAADTVEEAVEKLHDVADNYLQKHPTRTNP